MRFPRLPTKAEIGPACVTIVFTVIGLLGYHALPGSDVPANTEALAHTHKSAPISIPPGGSPIVLYNTSVWSHSLLRRAVWKVDRSWDERCQTVVTAVLEEHGFVVQSADAPHAVRGKREGVNLGVQCLSGQSHLLIFAVYARTRADQGRVFAAQFERRLRGAWTDLSL